MKALLQILLFICTSCVRAFLVGTSIPVADNPAGGIAMAGNMIIYFILAFFTQIAPNILYRVFLCFRKSQASPSFYLHLYFWGGLPLHVISFILRPEAAVFSFLPDLLLLIFYKIGTSLFTHTSEDR